jgi:Lactate racemase N-terminal domain
MDLPRFVLAEQHFPNRAISDIPGHIRKELGQAGLARRLPKGARIAIGVGSRGISNIATIVKSVVEFWKEQGAQPFLFPAMGSHGAATAEGQADVLAHYGIHEATIGAPVISSLDVVPLGKTPEGMETFIDKHAYESDGIFLVGRIKWHTDFSGALESGLFKMMAIGLGKFAGARQYHTFAYRLGLERVIRSAGSKIFDTGKILGGLAIQEGAHHETAGLAVVSGGQSREAFIAQEESLLREVKSWMAKLPAPEIDILIVDEIGKNISGAGMDTKVVNRSVACEYNPFPDTPIVRRIYARSLSELTYHSAVGLGMADVIHDRLLNDIDWKPTYINSLTASTPAAIRTPIHFPSDIEALTNIAPTVGKIDLSEVTYCRIHNTLELIHVAVSENLVPTLYGNVKVISEPFDVPLDAGDLKDFHMPNELSSGSEDFEEAGQSSSASPQIVRG